LLTSVYSANGLDDGPHTISLTNAEAGKFLDFDYMLVNSTYQPGTNPGLGTNTTDGQDAEEVPIRPEETSKAPIIGGAVGGVLAVLILGLLAWFLWRRRNKKRREDEYSDKPALDLTGDEVRPFRNSTTPPADDGSYADGQPSASTITNSLQGPNTSSTPYLSMVPHPPPSSNTSYPPSSSDHARQSYAELQPMTSPQRSGSGHDRSTIYSEVLPSEVGTFGPPQPHPQSPHPPVPPITQSYKSQSTQLPYTARRPSTLLSSDENSESHTHSRMFVAGREMDAGPLGPPSPTTEEPEILPPDYHQATEPLPGQRPPLPTPPGAGP
jgi:hypothetical protein